MITVSLCMIVKDEEKTLERCLQSIKKFVDEIIIVDTGSKDKTKQIAQKFTNKIYDFVWQNNFSMARNYAFSLASGEYIMWIDADDVVPKKTLNFLLKNKQKLTFDTYMLRYDVAFCGKKPTYSFYRERILKNTNSCVWQGAVHECIAPFGKVEKLNIPIYHKKEKSPDENRNLKIYQKLIKQKKLNAREQYYYSRELFDHQKYKSAIINFNKLLKMQNVWVEHIIETHYLLSICYQKTNNKEKQISHLLQTFKFAPPRANICCKIGEYFYTKGNFDTAIYWFMLATKCKSALTSGAFVDKKYFDYYPYLGLTCAYYYKKDYNMAYIYNEKAGKIIESREVMHNKKLLEQLCSNNQNSL